MSGSAPSAILFSVENGVARITLNRPDRLNAFTNQMHAEIAAALDTVEASDVRVLVITGAGRGFCAGQDLAERSTDGSGTRPDLGESLEMRYNPLVRRLTALPFPVIAAVNGVAAGAGANLALACDIVIARRSARFIQSFGAIGLVSDAGGTWHLPRLVGQARAMGLALLADPIDAETAERWGLIWRCAPDDIFEAEVEALADRLARAPTQALAAAKRAMRAAWISDLPTQLDLERDLQRALGKSADYAEGVAAFKTKRPPQFTGR